MATTSPSTGGTTTSEPLGYLEKAELHPTPPTSAANFPVRRRSQRSLLQVLSLGVAELFGTMIVVIFGLGSNAQSILAASSGTGSFAAIRLGWGVGLMLAVLFTGDVSGGHLNPAITIALAAFGKFPWRKVPLYLLAQIVGAFLGGVIAQANYYELANAYEGGYGIRTLGSPTSSFGVFVTTPADWMSNIGAFFDEVLGTFLLAATVCLIGQPENLALRLHTKAFILGAALIGVSSAVGVQTSFALNPARDLGPRIAASAFGYPSTIWTNRHGYWFWGPILGPIGGALLGVGAVEGMNKLKIAVDIDSRALL